MAPYRYLDHPAPPTGDQVHIHVPLDGDGPPAECVWAEPLGKDRYRILNVLFFTTEVGMHDVVLALEVDDVLELVAVVERRTHLHYSFEVPDGPAHDQLVQTANELGVAIERGFGTLFAANLPDRTNAAAFQRFLESHATWFEQTDVLGATSPQKART